MSKHGDTLVQHRFWKASVLKSTVIAWDLKLKILCFLRAFLVLQLLKINLPRLLRLPTFRNSESGIKGDSACSEVKKMSWGQGILETEEEDWFTQITAIIFFLQNFQVWFLRRRRTTQIGRVLAGKWSRNCPQPSSKNSLKYFLFLTGFPTFCVQSI